MHRFLNNLRNYQVSFNKNELSILLNENTVFFPYYITTNTNEQRIYIYLSEAFGKMENCKLPNLT